ncbi:hypothetical protein PHMEG_00022579, partial [Phytophthora megakarya]
MEMFKWMEWVISRNMAMSEVDDPMTRTLAAIKPVSSKTLTADSHLVMIDAVLDLYQKDRAMVLFAVSDNCSTNRAVATQMKVQTLYIQLRYVNNAAELTRFTKYKPLKGNATRWSSTYQLLTCYIKIRDVIKIIAAVEDLLPRPSTHRKIVQLVAKIEALGSVCIKLQSEEGNLADVRLLFDAVIAKYPGTAHHLSASAQVVHYPVFERTVVKLLLDRSLTSEVEEAVADFAGPTEPAVEAQKKTDIATETLCQATRSRRAAVTKYIDLLPMIPPTSNRCERSFSQCKLVLSPLRSSLLPANSEMLVFLRANLEL